MFCIGIHLDGWIWLSGIIYPNLSEGKNECFFCTFRRFCDCRHGGGANTLFFLGGALYEKIGTGAADRDGRIELLQQQLAKLRQDKNITRDL